MAQLLLVVGQAIRIVAGAGGEDAEPARLLRHHLATQFTIAELVIADDVDLADLRLGAFRDFKDDIDTVLVELHHLGLDRGREAALAAIEFDDAGNVGANLRPGVDLARRKLDLRPDLVLLQPLVAFQHDAVDDRIFLHLDGQRAIVVTDLDVREQLGFIQVAQRLIERFLGEGLAYAQLRVRQHRIGFETLLAHHADAADGAHSRRHGGDRCRRGRLWCFLRQHGNRRQAADHRRCQKGRDNRALSLAAHHRCHPLYPFTKKHMFVHAGKHGAKSRLPARYGLADQAGQAFPEPERR